MGFDINTKSENCETSLMSAADSGAFESAKILVNRNADLDIAYQGEGKTALMKSLESKNSEIATLLLEHNADYTKPDLNGKTPLMYAIDFQQASVIQILLEKKINIDIANNHGDRKSVV